jgi:hypothetical protein
MRTFLTAMALLVCVIGTAVSKRVSAMSRKIMLVLVAAAALAAVPIANAVAFSGGVSHVVTHPLAVTTAAVTAMPITRPTAATRPRDVRQHHARNAWHRPRWQSPAPELLPGVF